ncbi:hypothetical protein K7459_29950, partial [Pseudomonas fluorescens]|nr:hypothetical protein [Pseudomonas fluorescens]
SSPHRLDQPGSGSLGCTFIFEWRSRRGPEARQMIPTVIKPQSSDDVSAMVVTVGAAILSIIIVAAL